MYHLTDLPDAEACGLDTLAIALGAPAHPIALGAPAHPIAVGAPAHPIAVGAPAHPIAVGALYPRQSWKTELRLLLVVDISEGRSFFVPDLCW